MRVERADELRPQRLHDRRALVVEEVEVVQEARGLSHAEAEERVQAAHGRVEHLHGLARSEARPHVGLDGADDGLALPPELRRRCLERLGAEEHQRRDERRGDGAGQEPPARGECPRQLGGHQHGREGGQRIKVILPAFALRRVVHEAVGDAEGGDEMPRAPTAAQRGGERQGHAEREGNPRVPAIDVPRRGTAQPRIERDQVAGHDLVPGGEPAGEGQPAEHADRRRHHRREEQRGDAAGRHATAGARGGDGDDGGERSGEERRVRLHGDAGAERRPRPHEAHEPAALEPAHDAERPHDEQQAEQEVALARLPGAAGEMVRGEDERAGGRGERAPRRRERGDRAGGGREPSEVDDAPREVAAAERAQHGEVDQVRAGLIHVEQVTIRRRPVADPPRDVVHERHVVDERPRQRAPREQRDERGAGGDQRASGRNRPQ